MAAMQTVSARIPAEDLQWLATLDVQGATTPSDKLRALVAQLRRQHEGALEYSASLQWMRDLVAPFVTAVGTFEHRQGKHSEVVRLISDWVPQLMAILVAENSLGREPLRKAQEIEDKLVARAVQLLLGILRLGVTPGADCYDGQVLERYLPPIIELSALVESTRKTSGNKEK
ncbi:MAG TPA: hypothetical protein VGM84_24420 [Steroidobacteraceae bacterium]|jgi:hypothetical protein